MKILDLFENIIKCPECGKECKPLGLASHLKRVHHPDEVVWKNKDRMGWSKGKSKATDHSVAKISKSNTGKQYPDRKKISDDDRGKISASMKRAHTEDRAHNIGKSRWNNEPSYPEKFFAEVIANEFNDKAVQREYPIGRFSIDFAWVHLKKAIEIDGDQHERFEKQRESDARKDKTLKDAGWQVLRVKWKTMFRDTKVEIAKCKKFIDEQ